MINSRIVVLTYSSLFFRRSFSVWRVAQSAKCVPGENSDFQQTTDSSHRIPRRIVRRKLCRCTGAGRINSGYDPLVLPPSDLIVKISELARLALPLLSSIGASCPGGGLTNAGETWLRFLIIFRIQRYLRLWWINPTLPTNAQALFSPRNYIAIGETFSLLCLFAFNKNFESTSVGHVVAMMSMNGQTPSLVVSSEK